MARILVVDDDPGLRSGLADVLADMGLETDTAEDLAGARERIAEHAPDGLMVDLMLPDGSGLDLIDDLTDASTRVIVITGHADVDAAVRSLRARVHDFLVKPVDMQRVQALGRALLEEHRMPAPRGAPGSGLVGRSQAMTRVLDAVARVAPTDVNVLLVGESGTGKELVARAIHDASRRHAGPFLAVNCGALPSELIGSELFGHERGSFTGATRQHRGMFERASGGTLFLDEITEMPVDLQTTLLRVLETCTFGRIGGSNEIPADVRIVAATNREPEAAVQAGSLREDLYFRLTAFPLRLPRLAERPGDIPLLAEHILERLNASLASDKRLSSDAMAVLEAHEWPGNVRELHNVLQRAHILADEQIDAAQLGRAIGAGRRLSSGADQMGVGSSIRSVERQLIMDTLEYYEGDKRSAARVLGISLKTLYNRLKEYEAS